MPRLFAVAFAFLAAIALSSQPADAGGLLHRHKKVDKRVAATAIGAGVVSTVTAWSILDWSWNKHSAGYKWGVWGAVTGGCLVLSPMIAAAMVPERQLTTREVWVLEGSCVIPIIGGWLVNAAFDANPHWEGKPVKVAHRKRAKKM